MCETKTYVNTPIGEITCAYVLERARMRERERERESVCVCVREREREREREID